MKDFKGQLVRLKIQGPETNWWVVKLRVAEKFRGEKDAGFVISLFTCD
jgi:hypothetical protein